MQLIIQKKIEEEAKKRLSRPFQNLELSRFDAKRFEKRTGLVAPVPTLMRPPIWDAHKHFDPAYCLKHSKFLAKGIWKSLLSGNYSPNPSWRVNIPKSNGDMRPIDIMSIPDSAVSSVMYSNLIERNQRHFSAFSFAFRKDKGIFDAIEKIMHAISYPSLYVVNYDFSDFFGSINHEYLLNIIQEKRYFRFSKLEKNYLARLIKHQYGTISQFSSGDFDERNVGIPQGSSISLFLANIAAHELDMELERRNGSFARYSDDVVVICNSYEDSVGLKNVFHDFSQKSGISINKSKYQGVRILSNFIEEMRSVVSFDFLGYNFSKSGVVVSEKKVRAWKRRCAEIIYNNLLFYLHPSRSLPINHRRIGGLHHDWDLVQCINELRRYIYGGTKEHLVTGWLEDRVSIGKMRGVTAHFCMVNRNEQFSKLDGWLLNVLKRALRRREVLLRTQGVSYAVPDGAMILDGTWYRRASPRMETQLPSFSRAWRASRKRWLRHGYKGISDDWKIYEE